MPVDKTPGSWALAGALILITMILSIYLSSL